MERIWYARGRFEVFHFKDNGFSYQVGGTSVDRRICLCGSDLCNNDRAMEIQFNDWERQMRMSIKNRGHIKGKTYFIELMEFFKDTAMKNLKLDLENLYWLSAGFGVVRVIMGFKQSICIENTDKILFTEMYLK